MSISDYINQLRERAKRDQDKAREDTNRLCKLNGLVIYENASVALPADKTQATRRLIQEVINGEDQPGPAESDQLGRGDGSGDASRNVDGGGRPDGGQSQGP